MHAPSPGGVALISSQIYKPDTPPSLHSAPCHVERRPGFQAEVETSPLLFLTKLNGRSGRGISVDTLSTRHSNLRNQFLVEGYSSGGLLIFE